jgi:hypothetical protein
MSLPDAKPHIATLLDLCATRQAGITIYGRGEQSKLARLSYSELRALVTQKTDLLRWDEGIISSKIILIHF